MSSTVIKGGTVVTADLSYVADVLVEGGVITAIGRGRAYIYAKEDGTKVRMTVTVKEK